MIAEKRKILFFFSFSSQKLWWRLPAYQDAYIKRLHSNPLVGKDYQAYLSPKMHGCSSEAASQMDMSLLLRFNHSSIFV